MIKIIKYRILINLYTYYFIAKIILSRIKSEINKKKEKQQNINTILNILKYCIELLFNSLLIRVSAFVLSLRY